MGEIQLGDEVKDRVTGLVGIATARVQYLNGCIQYGVQRPLKKDGEKLSTEYIDQGQLVWVSSGLNDAKKNQTERAMTGGPQGHREPPQSGDLA